MKKRSRFATLLLICRTHHSCYRFLIFVFSIWLFAVSFFSSPANAALGDFLYKWGAYGYENGQFKNPEGIAIDGAGYIYVTDFMNSRVQVFNNAGSFITSWYVSNPYGIAIDRAGDIYVTDLYNSSVKVFNHVGMLLRQWGSFGSGQGQFSYATGISVDSSGHVYVLDHGNNRVQVFSNSGEFIRQWGTEGSGDGQLSPSYGIAVDLNKNVYVADHFNNRLQVFDNTGSFLRKWGTNGSEDGQFSYPRGVAVDSNGNVYIADTFNHRIQVFNDKGTFVGKWGTYGSGDGQLNYPVGIAVDTNGKLYVADNLNNRIQVFEGYKTDSEPPVVTLAVSPNILWPPNHNMVTVTIAGSATDSGSGIASTVISVGDEYGIYNFTSLQLGSTIELEAWREGTDMDGRQYTVTAVTTDKAGNSTTTSTVILVPHDMR